MPFGRLPGTSEGVWSNPNEVGPAPVFTIPLPERQPPWRCLILVDDLERRCRSRWFLFWRSAQFREDLAGARGHIWRFRTDADVGVLSKQNRRASQSTDSDR